jgi:flagellar motor switch protein FliN/FliY
MADNAKSDLSADDWAAAMAEQESAGRGGPQGSSATPQARVFPELSPDAGAGAAAGRLDMILDIPVQLTVELGRTKIAIRNLLQLAQGSVIELDRLAGEPMDVLVNGCLIAQGEVVVVNEKFGIRLTDVIAPDERLRRLNR